MTPLKRFFVRHERLVSACLSLSVLAFFICIIGLAFEPGLWVGLAAVGSAVVGIVIAVIDDGIDDAVRDRIKAHERTRRLLKTGR